MTRQLILSSLILLTSATIFGQTPPTKPIFVAPQPHSAQASALIKSIEYPVDYARGLPKISIPLYNIQVNDITIPLALNYHAGGNKVFDMSGWVGLGWSVGGSPGITRSINGKADEFSFLTSSLLGSNIKEHLELAADGVNDELPDQFFYSLLDNNGSFFFNRKPNVSGYTIQTLPFDPIKIENTGGVNSFKIIDDAGRQFIFQVSDREQNDLMDVNAWKISKIVSANRVDTVHFFYHPPRNEITPSPQSHSITIDDEGSAGHTEMSGSVQICSGQNVQIVDEQLPKPVVKKSVNGTVKTYLYDNATQQFVYFRQSDAPDVPIVWTTSTLYTQEIRFRGGKVVFEIDLRIAPPGAQIRENSTYLKRVIVYDENGKLIKSVVLKYQDFLSTSTVPNNPGGSYIESRLLLDSVKIYNGISALPESYKLVYNVGTKLPNRFSYDMDMWGYYNGPVNNTNLVPATTIETRKTGGALFNTVLGEGNRQSNDFSMKAGILEEIYYPTGGHTFFTYEANKAFNFQTGFSKLVGGLRIKFITDFNDANVARTREFRYGENEGGSGNMRHWVGGGVYDPFVIQQNKYARVETVGFGCSGGTYMYNQGPENVTSRFRTIMSNPVTDLFYDGAVVVYPQVTEYNGSGTVGGHAGKTTYSFFFSGMGSGGGYETPYFINGTTLPYDKKTDWIYGFENKAEIKKGSSVYSTIQQQESSYLPTYDANKIWARSIFRTTFFAGAPSYPGYTNPTSIQVQTFQTQVNEYESGFNKLMSTVTKTLGDNGVEMTTTQSYAYANNYIKSPTSVSKTGSDGVQQETKFYYPHQMVTLGETEPYQEMVNRNIISPVIVAEEYADNIVQTKTKGHFARNWPANSALILPAAFKWKFKTLAEEDRKLVLSYDMYGNITEFRNANDKIESCYWGYSARNLTALVTGAALDQTAYTSFETNEKGNWSYSGTPSSDASSLTGSKVYTLNGSITRTGLSAVTTYIVSYWRKSGTVTVGSTPGVTGRTFGSWTYYEHLVVNPVGGQITVTSANNAVVDELRLYPATAQMTTMTYEPLIGMKSQCDANNSILYYQYDANSRLELIRDGDNNILKKFCYNYNGQPEGCFKYYNVQKSQSFQKVCSTGYTGSQVVYTVPANTYTSTISQPDADAMAQAQVTANGQAYANANGVCNVTCTTGNCVGTGKKCVNNICETGLKTYTSSEYDPLLHKYVCHYRYQYSDGSYSSQFTELSPSPCLIPD